MLKILGKPTSINVRKLLWLCEELGLAYELEAWGSGFRDTHTPEFLALNPNAMVPVLIDTDVGGAAGAVLWESNTICRYLAGQAGRDDLLPREPLARARVEQWMDWQATDLNTAWRTPFLGLVRHSPAHQDAAALAAAVASWNHMMTILDRQLQSTGAWAAGEAFTLADIGLGLSVNRWFMTPMQRPSLAAVSAYYDRLTARPGYAAHGRNGTP